MQDAAGILGLAGEIRRIASGVIVIAAAGVEEAASELPKPFFRADRHIDQPQACLGVEIGGEDAMLEQDFLVHAALARGLADIGQHVGALASPGAVEHRTVGKCEGLQVGVGTHAGIAKQVPGAAARLAAFQNGEAGARRKFLDIARRCDPGHPGAQDENLERLVLRLPVFLSRLIWRRKIEHFALPGAQPRL